VRTILAVALLATTASTAATTAPFAQQAELLQTQAAPSQQEPDSGPGRWMHDGGSGTPGRGGMMLMHRMMMRRNPQERCQERLAWRAAMRTYTEAMLNLTPEQRPLWDRVQNIAQSEEQKERQLCATLKPADGTTLPDRLDGMQQFLSTRLEAVQAAKPAVQALYQALSPEQRAILDHPFRR
jgi:LTXXQ motif family protein